jgi:glucokinase
MGETDGGESMATTLTIDIGGTKCAVAITDDSGVHGKESWPTTGSTENLERAVTFYRQHLESGADAAVAVGVSFGGPVDFRTATVKRSVHVSGWSGFDFRTWSRDTLNLPIAVDNDAKVGALAEFHHGGHGVDDLMYVTVSTGIGAGVISSGQIVRGASNEAGELGHTRVSDDDRKCSCGRTGCLERLCSGYWIEQDHGKPATELFADDVFLAEYSRVFARGLSHAVLMYNPSAIVLGGGVSRVGTRLTESLTDSVRRELASWSHMVPTISTSKFDSEGVHLGAKELTRDLF